MRTALIALIPMMLACTAPTTQAQEPATVTNEMQRTISVSGEGRAAGVPDMATLNFGVQAQGASAGAALKANADQMNSVMQKLKSLGIAARDLQTSNFSLNPIYARDERGRTDTNRITGYRTVNTLTVRVRDIGKVGDTIDQAVGAGANNFNGLSFGFQSTDELMDDARRNAVRNARATADLLAEEAGVKVGRVMTMSENFSRPQPRPMARMAMAEDSMASTPIEAGESELSATVHFVFELK